MLTAVRHTTAFKLVSKSIQTGFIDVTQDVLDTCAFLERPMKVRQ